MSYWDDLESMAEDIIESEGIDEDKWHDRITEDVDGSSYIIYYAEQDEVLSKTKNYPDERDVAGMCESGDWQKVKTITAYLAMERDLWDTCRKVVDDYFECEECSGAIKNSDETDDIEEHTGRELCHPCFLKLIDEKEETAEVEEVGC
jgi:hypothetical protein